LIENYEDDFTLEEVEYAVGDSMLVYWLIQPLLTRLLTTNQWEMFKDLEMPVLQEFVRSELHGIPVDYKGLYECYEELGINLNDQFTALQDQIQADFPGLLQSEKQTFKKGEFNPKSSAQVPSLLSHYGLMIPSTSKDVLKTVYSENPLKIQKELMTIEPQVMKEVS
jgi:DNA polymerase I-like protein with 3'-5' exonuclease and polymerase domains